MKEQLCYDLVGPYYHRLAPEILYAQCLIKILFFFRDKKQIYVYKYLIVHRNVVNDFH